MARACAEPRASQNTMVPFTTPCMTGRNEYAPRFDVIDPPGQPAERAISSSRGVALGRIVAIAIHERDPAAAPVGARLAALSVAGAAHAHDLCPPDRFGACHEQRVQEPVDHGRTPAVQVKRVQARRSQRCEHREDGQRCEQFHQCRYRPPCTSLCLPRGVDGGHLTSRRPGRSRAFLRLLPGFSRPAGGRGMLSHRTGTRRNRELPATVSGAVPRAHRERS